MPGMMPALPTTTASFAYRSHAAVPAGAGVAAAWTGSTYILISSDGYSLSSCSFDPSSGTWSSKVVIAPATSTAIGRFAPRLSLADGLYTLTCIEFDTGLLTGSVYTYPRLRQSADLIHWSNSMIVPDLTRSYGAVSFKILIQNW